VDITQIPNPSSVDLATTLDVEAVEAPNTEPEPEPEPDSEPTRPICHIDSPRGLASPVSVKGVLSHGTLQLRLRDGSRVRKPDKVSVRDFLQTPLKLQRALKNIFRVLS
jgi:hypothetical protein